MFCDVSSLGSNLSAPVKGGDLGAIVDDTAPPTPTKLLNRKDLARLFGVDVQSVKRWDRRSGWLTPIRASNGVRIVGYHPAETAKVATRLFAKGRGFDETEAHKLGYYDLLLWIKTKSQLSDKRRGGQETAVSRDLLFLSALSGTCSALPSESGLLVEDIEAFEAPARKQLQAIMAVPVALRLLLKGFREAMIQANSQGGPTRDPNFTYANQKRK